MRIKRKSNIFILFFLLTGLAGAAEPSFLKDCKQWTPAQWDEFYANMTDSKNLLSYGGFSEVGLNIRKKTLSCKDALAAGPIAKCSERIMGYLKNFEMDGKGTHSASLTDKEYHALIPPEAKYPPKELFDGDTLRSNWKDIIKKNGWSYAHFNSGTGDTPRLLIRVPGKKYDQLLVMYSWYPDAKDPRNPVKFDELQMQIISHDSQPTKNEKTEIFFQAYSLRKSKNAPTLHAALKVPRCITCHSSGPRAVVPTRTDEFKPEVGGTAKSLAEFNQQIILKSAPDLNPYYDTKNVPTKMKLGKDCVQCHNGTERSSLAMFINRSGGFTVSEIHRKVVTEETMPREYYGGDLNRKDREDIMSKLRTEYADELGKWLRETKCNTADGKDAPAVQTPARANEVSPEGVQN